MTTNEISGWDILDSLLAALPLGIVVFALVLVALSVAPARVSWDTVWALSGFIVAVQFAYNMNQLINPRYAEVPKS